VDGVGHRKFSRLFRRCRLRLRENADYQKEAQLIADEFTQSDWEALEAIESQEVALQ
jgi:hypothetical protein